MDFIIFIVLMLLGYGFGTWAESRHYKSIEKREVKYQKLPTIALKHPIPQKGRVVRAQLASGNVVISVDYFKTIPGRAPKHFRGTGQCLRNVGRPGPAGSDTSHEGILSPAQHRSSMSGWKRLLCPKIHAKETSVALKYLRMGQPSPLDNDIRYGILRKTSKFQCERQQAYSSPGAVCSFGGTAGNLLYFLSVPGMGGGLLRSAYFS